MKKTAKVLAMVLIAILLISIASSVFATEGLDTKLDPSQIKGNTTGTDKVQGLGKQIIGFIQIIGSLASVGILVILGVKYMIGSAEEKAEYKKTMIPYMVGAVLVFAASNIAGFIFQFANTIQ